MITVKSNKTPFSCNIETANSHFLIVSDVAKEKGGNNEGISPHELLAASIGTCTNIWVRMHASKKNIHLESISVDVEIDRTDQNKTTFIIKANLPENLNAKDRKQLLGIISSCPIKKTLSKELVFKQIN